VCCLNTRVRPDKGRDRYKYTLTNFIDSVDIHFLEQILKLEVHLFEDGWSSGYYILPPIQGIRRSRFTFFCLTKNFFKYIKIVCMKLALLENVFQYESNDTNYI
jgi:hypothetical protein